MKDLEGKVVVVTGGGSGIGKETCLLLGKEGATVAVSDLRAETAQAVADQITAAGGAASAHGVDVSSEEQVRALYEEVLAQHRVVDVLMNNAGIAVDTVPTVDTPLSIYHKVLDVNLWGVINGTSIFLPHLLTRPKANVVNTCSFAGLVGMNMMSPYNVSKFGVRGYTEALQMEFNKTALTVTLVCPGGTRTPLMSNSPAIDDSKKDKLTANLMKSKQTKSPEQVAAAMVAGLKKDKLRVLVGSDTKMLDKVARMMPNRYPRILSPQMKKLIEKTLAD